ncbi:MAG TPA: rhodanese-like domain-containing protein, partial [Polyangiaceae bacterium]|nr:rhodanese-like domain-containing protein [Polyangiaceae bacterium]
MNDVSQDVPRVVGARWLSEHAEQTDRAGALRIVDTRWYLQHKSGREEYARGHIPGAVFLPLEDITAEQGPGRHPIPSAEKFAEAMRAAGISQETHVVAYDDAGGSIAARLAWLLRRYGHRRVSVLDGGLQAWTAEGLALSTLSTHSKDAQAHGDFVAAPDPGVSVVDKAYVNAARARV